MYSSYRSSRKNTSPWKLLIIGGVGFLIFMMIFLGEGEKSRGDDFLSVEASTTGSQIVISRYNKTEEKLKGNGRLYPDDISLTVDVGQARINPNSYGISLDKGSQISYTSLSGSEKTLNLMRGRLWSESKENYILKLKNIEAKVTPGDVILAEQQSQIYSIIYVLSGSVDISGGGRSLVLSAGNRVMISQSDLVNPSNTLENLMGKIDDSIRQNPFFIYHGGESYLSNISKTKNSMSGSTSTGNIISPSQTRTIEITFPEDEGIVQSETIDISGKLLVQDIRKITINEKETKISPVDEVFSLKGFSLSDGPNNLVYKVYNTTGSLIEKGVITVYSKNKGMKDKLIPTNFSTGDAKFRFTSPGENPYRTFDNAVTVSGVVPKDTVEYITVNGYRLKKFIPKSTTWYYYANTEYKTMNEGFNLYQIQFYGANDTLLSTQVFTIIKESKTLSGE